MMTGWSWLGIALAVTAVGQLVFKQASMKRSWSLTVLAAGLFCLAPPASYMALHRLSLATVYVSTAISQLLVVIVSLALFQERYSTRQWLGLTLILVGVLTFNSNTFL